MTKSVVDQIMQGLAFEVEAVPQQDSDTTASASYNKPMNVRIRVKNKDDCGMQHVSKYSHHSGGPGKVKVISSDQTVMSFDVCLDTDNAKKSKRKPRKSFLGSCLGIENDDEKTSYLPSTIYSAKLIDGNVASKSDGSFKQHYTLSKTNYENASLQSYPKKNDFLGKCKPGGCLDPPFGEEKYAYEPAHKQKLKKIITSINEEATPVPTIIKLSKRVPFDSPKTKISKDKLLQKTPLMTEDSSIMSLYDAKFRGSVDSKYSDSVLTYPPDITSSTVSNEKALRTRVNSEEKQRKSLNESVEAFFSSPRKNSLYTEKSKNTKDLAKVNKNNPDEIIFENEKINSIDRGGKPKSSEIRPKNKISVSSDQTKFDEIFSEAPPYEAFDKITRNSVTEKVVSENKNHMLLNHRIQDVKTHEKLSQRLKDIMPIDGINSKTKINDILPKNANKYEQTRTNDVISEAPIYIPVVAETVRHMFMDDKSNKSKTYEMKSEKKIIPMDKVNKMMSYQNISDNTIRTSVDRINIQTKTDEIVFETAKHIPINDDVEKAKMISNTAGIITENKKNNAIASELTQNIKYAFVQGKAKTENSVKHDLDKYHNVDIENIKVQSNESIDRFPSPHTRNIHSENITHAVMENDAKTNDKLSYVNSVDLPAEAKNLPTKLMLRTQTTVSPKSSLDNQINHDLKFNGGLSNNRLVEPQIIQDYFPKQTINRESEISSTNAENNSYKDMHSNGHTKNNKIDNNQSKRPTAEDYLYGALENVQVAVNMKLDEKNNMNQAPISISNDSSQIEGLLLKDMATHKKNINHISNYAKDVALAATAINENNLSKPVLRTQTFRSQEGSSDKQINQDLILNKEFKKNSTVELQSEQDQFFKQFLYKDSETSSTKLEKATDKKINYNEQDRHKDAKKLKNISTREYKDEPEDITVPADISFSEQLDKIQFPTRINNGSPQNEGQLYKNEATHEEAEKNAEIHNPLNYTKETARTTTETNVTNSTKPLLQTYTNVVSPVSSLNKQINQNSELNQEPISNSLFAAQARQFLEKSVLKDSTAVTNSEKEKENLISNKEDKNLSEINIRKFDDISYDVTEATDINFNGESHNNKLPTNKQNDISLFEGQQLQNTVTLKPTENYANDAIPIPVAINSQNSTKSMLLTQVLRTKESSIHNPSNQDLILDQGLKDNILVEPHKQGQFLHKDSSTSVTYLDTKTEKDIYYTAEAGKKVRDNVNKRSTKEYILNNVSENGIEALGVNLNEQSNKSQISLSNINDRPQIGAQLPEDSTFTLDKYRNSIKKQLKDDFGKSSKISGGIIKIEDSDMIYNTSFEEIIPNAINQNPYSIDEVRHTKKDHEFTKLSDFKNNYEINNNKENPLINNVADNDTTKKFNTIFNLEPAIKDQTQELNRNDIGSLGSSYTLQLRRDSLQNTVYEDIPPVPKNTEDTENNLRSSLEETMSLSQSSGFGKKTNSINEKILIDDTEKYHDHRDTEEKSVSDPKPIKKTSQLMEIMSILDDKPIFAKSPTVNELSDKDSIKLPNSKIYKNLNKPDHKNKADDKFKSLQVSKSPLKKDVVSLDLAFQSYLNDKKDRTIITIDKAKEPVRYPDDAVTVIQSQLIPNGNEIRIPIDLENEMTIKIRRNKSPTRNVKILKGESIMEAEKETSEVQRQDLSNSGNLSCSDISTNKLLDKITNRETVKVLNAVYEQELVPLQNTIKYLKQEIDAIFVQQARLVEELSNAIRAKPIRLIRVNPRCGCWKK